MATVWLLIAISNSMYNYGNMSSIEFATKQDSEVNRNTKFFCVKK